jgi:repressor LexA
MKTITYIDDRTPRERILEFIKQYIEEHCYPPTTREIAAGVGLKSASTVCEHIKTLMQFGLIETDAEIGSNRALRVVGMKMVRA